MYLTREDTRGLAGDYVEKSWGVEGASEREKEWRNEEQCFISVYFQFYQRFIVSMLRIGVLYW
jgi:hypothetical protein